MSFAQAAGAWASCLKNSGAWTCAKGFADKQSAEAYYFGERGVPTACQPRPDGLLTCKTLFSEPMGEVKPPPDARVEIRYATHVGVIAQDREIRAALRPDPVVTRVADPAFPLYKHPLYF